MNISTTYSLSVPSLSRSRSRGAVFQVGRPFWAFLFLGLASLGAVAYLLLVNDTATIGLSMKSAERELATLQEETRQLEITLANLQSFSTVERTGRALDLTEQVSAEFLTIPDENVAVR